MIPSAISANPSTRSCANVIRAHPAATSTNAAIVVDLSAFQLIRLHSNACQAAPPNPLLRSHSCGVDFRIRLQADSGVASLIHSPMSQRGIHAKEISTSRSVPWHLGIRHHARAVGWRSESFGRLESRRGRLIHMRPSMPLRRCRPIPESSSRS
jgi:hypothetical protein